MHNTWHANMKMGLCCSDMFIWISLLKQSHMHGLCNSEAGGKLSWKLVIWWSWQNFFNSVFNCQEHTHHLVRRMLVMQQTTRPLTAKFPVKIKPGPKSPSSCLLTVSEFTECYNQQTHGTQGYSIPIGCSSNEDMCTLPCQTYQTHTAWGQTCLQV